MLSDARGLDSVFRALSQPLPGLSASVSAEVPLALAQTRLYQLLTSNEPPSDLELLHITAWISERECSQALDPDVPVIMTHIPHPDLLSSLKSVIAPIRRLPTELLMHIFQEYNANDVYRRLPDGWITKSGPFVLRNVCARWRDVADASAAFWSRISVVRTFIRRRAEGTTLVSSNVDPNPESDPDLRAVLYYASQALRLSSSRPSTLLSVSLKFKAPKGTPLPSVYPLIQSFFTSFSRIRHLSLAIDKPIFLMLCGKVRAQTDTITDPAMFPELESLSLERTGWYNPMEIPPSDVLLCFLHSTKLRKVRLSGRGVLDLTLSLPPNPYPHGIASLKFGRGILPSQLHFPFIFQDYHSLTILDLGSLRKGGVSPLVNGWMEPFKHASLKVLRIPVGIWRLFEKLETPAMEEVAPLGGRENADDRMDVWLALIALNQWLDRSFSINNANGGSTTLMQLKQLSFHLRWVLNEALLMLIRSSSLHLLESLTLVIEEFPFRQESDQALREIIDELTALSTGFNKNEAKIISLPRLKYLKIHHLNAGDASHSDLVDWEDARGSDSDSDPGNEDDPHTIASALKRVRNPSPIEYIGPGFIQMIKSRAHSHSNSEVAKLERAFIQFHFDVSIPFLAPSPDHDAMNTKEGGVEGDRSGEGDEGGTMRRWDLRELGCECQCEIVLPPVS
jgi:hypothetical protein